VVRQVLDIFKKKFQYFVQNIAKSDVIFSKSYASFDSACANAKLWTKCGACKSFMKIVQNYHKIICDKCDNTWMLPKNCKYKSMEGVKCSKDNYEIFQCLKMDEKDVEFTFYVCPKCFHEANYKDEEKPESNFCYPKPPSCDQGEL
jgi:hypothetical protein